MEPMYLSDGKEAFTEIKDYIRRNFRPRFTLSLFDTEQEETAEIECDVSDMVDCIYDASRMEGAYPVWIGINEITDSYVVGMPFKNGNIETPSVYEYSDGELERIG